MTLESRLREAAVLAFDRRRRAGLALVDDAGSVARTAHAMALRFLAGGKLIAFGTGPGSTDAQHLAVEFVHPVIVGTRALPAISLTGDVATLTAIATRAGWDEVFARQLRSLARPVDIALGISVDGRCRNVLRGLEVARELGLLTVGLAGADGGPLAASPAVDHPLVARVDDPAAVKEIQVATYHILWELVHVFLEQPGALGPGRAADRAAAADGVEALYPSLYGRTVDLEAILWAARRSTEAKAHEIADLRDRLGNELEGPLIACALAMARAFARGATLFALGNGGSSTDAQAVAQLFLAPPRGGALPALSLTNDVAAVTALSNDVGFEVAFARLIGALGAAGDIAMGLSTSGCSGNVLRALDEAAGRGLLTVGFAGYAGGRMAEAGSIRHLFVVPSSSVHRIQEAQTTLYHVLWELTREALEEGGFDGGDEAGREIDVFFAAVRAKSEAIGGAGAG
jgi:D-sedoheptulose 7-phosphate isomerase